jgi:hypothetical protein
MQPEFPHEFSFPVVGYKIIDGKAKTDNLFGTATYIGNKIFITAGHTILNAKESENMGVAFRKHNDSMSGYTYISFTYFEIFEDIDLALLKLDNEIFEAKAEKWTTKNTEFLEDVYTIGYPFGYNISQKEFIVRGLKGHIVTRRPFHEFENKPLVYELSFHCPKGISGASLRNFETSYIKGFIIANASTEILVFKEKEVDDNNNEKTIYEKYETTKYGIAITVNNILDKSSKILGTTFRKYLKKENLLVE